MTSSHHAFCTCLTRVVFEETASGTQYRCPCCNNSFAVEGEGTLLYELTTTQTGDIFDALLSSSAHDPCNKKIVEACPNCLRPVITSIMIGVDEKPFKTCKCGLKVSIEQSVK
jgi:hypothetical protein